MVYDMAKEDKRKEELKNGDPSYTPIKIVGCLVVLAFLVALSVMQFKHWVH